GDDRCNDRRRDQCSDRPIAALHFLPPTGHSRSGRSSFDSKLISLLPLDEVPVHVHRFAARAPCDWKGSECQCGIHRAEAASALRSRKTEGAAKEKPTPISHIFFSTCCAKAPKLAATPWGGSPPRPLCQKICYSDCTKNRPLRPLGALRRFRNPKIGQQLGAQPTPRFRVMIEALLDALLDAGIDPLPPFTFCRPFSFDSKLIW